MKKRVAIYARVSTTDGRQDPEVQLQPLREYCKQRGFTVHKEYVDKMSGSRDDRPALARMMDDARKRKIDAVLVFYFDRFARSVKQLVLALEEFNQLGIDFISYSENIDTSTPMGRVLFTIVSAMAEFERSLIQERVRAGLQKAKRDGKRLGRPVVQWDVETALFMKRKGNSWADVSEAVGVSVSTLRRTIPPLLKNPRK